MTDTDKMYGTALIKGKEILDFLERCNHAPSLTEITEGTSASKPTTLKLLTTMSALRLVRRDDETKRYYLGPQLISYGERAAMSFDIAAVARPFLRELRDKTGETINLGVISDGRILLIEKLESPMSIKLQSVVGGTMPLYSSAMGKAVLADYDTTLLDQYLEQHKLKQVTPKTLTNRKSLLEDLAGVKERGVAIDNEENEVDVYCLGVVLHQQNRIVGAFSVSSPKYRVDDKRKNDFVSAILKTKRAIEAQL